MVWWRHMSRTSTNPDGTQVTHPDDVHGVLYYPALSTYDPGRRIPSCFACQLAIAELLDGIVAVVKDDEKIAAGVPAPAREVEIKTIYIDWPPNEAQLSPAMATIMEVDEQDFGDEIGVSRYLEETRHKFGEGTVLFRHTFSTLRFAVHMIFGHRDDRRAFRAEIEKWLTEPQSERQGRGVIVPAYYGAQVQLALASLQNLDDGDKAQRNIWALVAGVVCRVPVLELVGSPAKLRTPGIDVAAG